MNGDCVDGFKGVQGGHVPPNLAQQVPGEAVRCLYSARKPFSGRRKCRIDFGSAPDPAWGTYSTPRPPSWWGGYWLPPPQEHYSRSRPFGPRTLAIWASSQTRNRRLGSSQHYGLDPLKGIGVGLSPDVICFVSQKK